MGTDPRRLDTDNDGLNDDQERTTDPNQSDTDGDQIPDGLEDENGNGVCDPTATDPRLADTAGDGLLDGMADLNRDGILDENESDPRHWDSDHDGLNDAIERSGLTDAREADTDQDGLLDGREDTNGNGRFDVGETNQRAPIPMVMAYLTAKRTETAMDRSIRMKPILVWRYDFGEHDGAELSAGRGPLDILDDLFDPQDQDGDGVLDQHEDINHGRVDDNETDPGLADTDNDGLEDGLELANGTTHLNLTG